MLKGCKLMDKKPALGILAICLISIVFISGCIEERNTGLGCKVDEDCSLSLCDCNCHVSGQTPEELEGKLCGINCREQYSVLRCECSIQPSGEGICVKVLE